MRDKDFPNYLFSYSSGIFSEVERAKSKRRSRIRERGQAVTVLLPKWRAGGRLGESHELERRTQVSMPDGAFPLAQAQRLANPSALTPG